MDNFYKNFEDKFRGSKDEIKKRLLAYLPFLEILKDSGGELTAIDLGCGRGEWLELLAENKFSAQGCDLDDAMIAECAKAGLNAQKADAIEFLSKFKDSSVSLVSGFQIAEHLEFSVLQTLIKEAFRVLKDGGILLLETPNPENLRVATMNFYLDPSHVKPIPPILLEYLFKFHGFGDTFMMRLNSNLSFSENLNEHNITLRDVLASVGLDYAVLAVKNIDKSKLDRFNAAALQGFSFEELADKFDVQTFEKTTQIYELKNEIWKNDLEIRDKIFVHENNILDLKDADENFLAKYLALNHEVHVLKQENERLKSDVYHLNAFMFKFKRIFAPLIWVYKFLRAVKNFIKNGIKSLLRRGINFTEGLAHKHPWIKKNLKIFLTKFPFIRTKIYNLKGQVLKRDDIYISGEEEFKPNLFAPLHSSEYELNLALKRADCERNFGELTVIGSISGHYSLAAINRNVVFRALEKMKEVFAICYHEKYFDKIEEIAISREEYETLRRITPNPNAEPKFDENKVAIYHHYPIIEDTRPQYGLELAIFFWEESRIPQHSVDVLNTKYKGILVSTYFIKKILIDNGCYTPIKVADIPLTTPPAITLTPKKSRNEIGLFHISSCLPRKGADVLLRAFNDACKRAKFMLTLTIKTFPNPHNTISEQVELLVDEKYRNRVRLIFDEHLTATDIAHLYDACDIVVLPTRGEGLNMPAIEGTHYHKPIITTDFSAQCEFLRAPTKFINYKFTPAVTHFNLNYSFWAEPSHKDLSDKILELSNQILAKDERLQSAVNELKSSVDEMMFGEHGTVNFISAVSFLKSFKFSQERPNIAFFSTYNTSCGIAEYSKYLTDAIKNLGINVQIHSWSEQDDVSIIKVEQSAPLANLTTDANIIWLQHHFTFFEFNERLRADIVRLKSEGKLLFITLHTTKQILNHPRELQTSWHETLALFDRVFVHGIDDLNTLRLLGLTDNVTIVPHGTQNLLTKAKREDKIYTIGFFGLMFAHKNLPTLIEAFAKFSRERDARLVIASTIINDDSRGEYARCQKLADKFGIADKIVWHTDFLPLDEVNAILSGCDCVVLPYGQTDEGASGAARIALSACQSVIVTPSRIFDEMRSVTIQTDGFEVQDILESLNLVYNNGVDSKIYDKRKAWLDENSWENIARKCADICKAMLVDREFLQHIKKEMR